MPCALVACVFIAALPPVAVPAVPALPVAALAVPELLVAAPAVPGLFVVPPPIEPIVVLVDELLSRDVFDVVPTLPVGEAAPELTASWAVTPVCAWAVAWIATVPATRATAMTIREIIGSPGASGV